MPPRTRKTAASEAAAIAAEDARAAALSSFIKKAGAGAVFRFDGTGLNVPVVSTGAPSLDFALGVGGLPRGRIIEIYGPESVGKTSLALSVAAQAIKAGGMASIIDVEHAINPDHVKGMGVDQDYLAISQPDSGEKAFGMLEDMLKADLFDVIVVDSVAMMVPQVELDGEMEDMQVGAQARMMSKGLRKVTGIIGGSKAVVIFINQLRMKIGGYGNPEDTPGGKALKYAASVRLDVRAAAGDRIKDPNDAKKFIGLGTKVKVVKNKVAPPQKVAEYNLIWGKGIDAAASVFQIAKDLGVIVADGGNAYTLIATGEVFTGEDGKTIRGAGNIQAHFSANPDIAAQVSELCYAAMRDRGEGAGADGPIPDRDFLDAEEDAALAAMAS